MTLAVDNISLQLGARRVLSDISLTLKAGHIVALAGPNGAGKSSLLRVMAGEWMPLSGQVTLAGRTLDHWDQRERARALAVLPQHSSLNFAFSVFEVVMLGRTPHAGGRREDDSIVTAALAAVDAAALRDRNYPELSGGEKQRVQLARVLAQVWTPAHPLERYALLDEPASGLDLSHQALLLSTLRQAAADGLGVLVVLHDLNLAARLADTIVLLDRGTMAGYGTPADVLKPALIKSVFDIDATVMPHPRDGAPLVIV